MITRYIPAIALTLVILMISGCGTSAKIEQGNAKSLDLSSYDTIQIEVTSLAKNMEREIQMIESLTAARLSGLDLFQRVTAASRMPDDNPKLTLKAIIKNIRDVAPGTRQRYGYWAGNAHVLLAVQLVANEKILDEFIVKGVGFGDGFASGSTDTAINLSVTRIVEYITEAKNH